MTLAEKPIESHFIRPLDSDNPIGRTLLWIETFTKKESDKYPLINLSRQKGEKFQIRLILWSLSDVKKSMKVVNK